MIIVEGPDGSGKTTLITQLGFSRHQLKSLRGGVGGTTKKGWGGIDEAMVAYVKQIRAMADPKGAFDRFHLSEHVYGPILRDKQELPPADLEFLNGYIHRQQIPVILCLPPWETTLANVMQEGRERPSYQTEEFLLQAYKVWKTMTPWATIVYDYTREQVPTI